MNDSFPGRVFGRILRWCGSAGVWGVWIAAGPGGGGAGGHVTRNINLTITVDAIMLNVFTIYRDYWKILEDDSISLFLCSDCDLSQLI